MEAESLRNEFNENLSLSLRSLRLLNVYDLFGFSDELLGEMPLHGVRRDGHRHGRRRMPARRQEISRGGIHTRAVRPARPSAVDCVHLIDPSADVQIRSSRLLIFDDDGLGEEALAQIRHYYINAVESRPKDLGVLRPFDKVDVKPLVSLDGFIDMQPGEYADFCSKWGLAMNADDLAEVVKYFPRRGAQPTETELRILDTYWSDHCRHTTFTTELQEISVEDSFLRGDLRRSSASSGAYASKELGREDRRLCLMELATIGARYLKKQGLLDDLEQSEENNACSVYVDVDVDGHMEKWLLQFKNETHNHPTEIEPFGGASTCLGGAIRDPLSGRAYIYQAMRVTGAGDITAPVSETLPGKLPQRVISRKGCGRLFELRQPDRPRHTCVREIYHPAMWPRGLRPEPWSGP